MRLAGTCSRYSKQAIPQLTKAAMYHGRSLRSLRWAYQAKVMNTLDAASKRMVRVITDISVNYLRSLENSTDSLPKDRWLGCERSVPVGEILLCGETGIECMRERIHGGPTRRSASCRRQNRHSLRFGHSDLCDCAPYWTRRAPGEWIFVQPFFG